ncbi:MAG: glutamate-cysteine ligase family protein [Thermodesulfobacteriota bacterium]
MSRLGLFQGFGVELEYMLVDAATLDVLPAADRLLEAAAGRPCADVELGATAWSNELALHVLEMKTNGPAPGLAGLAAVFQPDVARANALAAGLGGRLLPGGAHPWMDPARETRLWPHEDGPIYRAYDRIFGCRGHGWSNLQSTHLNLPFAGDAEFGRLHAAVRLLLPILPALSASSPILDGRPTGLLDSRMETYRHNSARVPSVCGLVIPEPVYDEAAYRRDIFERMYRDMAPLDPEGVLRHEFLNARGAIARFDRGAIEIRVLDIQECPAADLGLAALACAALQALAAERWAGLAEQQAFGTEPLARILLACIRDAEQAVLDDPRYLAALGLPGESRLSAAELWSHLLDAALPPEARDPAWDPALAAFSDQGCLARRILAALGGDYRREPLREVYADLAGCLDRGEAFRA